MSKRLDTLFLSLIPKEATKEEVLAILLNCCDDDFNGTNGATYVHEEFKTLGYSSNAAYYFDQVWDSHLNHAEKIEHVLLIQYGENEDRYADYKIETTETETDYVLAAVSMVNA